MKTNETGTTDRIALKDEILTLATNLAKQVGAVVSEQIKSEKHLQVNFKSRKDIVTELDIWAENTIEKGIHSRFPEHTFIGEETSTHLVAERKQSLGEIISSDCISWIVDPIDGTTNFANKIPHYAISIGIAFNGVCEVGVVYDPSRGELFQATKGGGAFLNRTPIAVSNKDDLLDCVIATGRPGDWIGNLRIEDIQKYEIGKDSLTKKVRSMRKFGAAALDFCWVACARLDACFEPYLKPWDVAAGSLIAEESGAKIGHFTEEEAPFSLISSSFIAATPAVFDEIIRAMK